MNFLKSIVIALLFLIAITFALKNNESVAIKYYFVEGTLELPLYLLLFFSLIIGIIIGGVEGIVDKIRNANTIRKLKKEMKAKEDELTSLRNLPLTESRVHVSGGKDKKSSESEESYLGEA